MNPLPHLATWRRRRFGRTLTCAAMLAGAMLLGGCVTNGDFGRVRPSLVKDDIHDWVGREAVIAVGGQPSEYPLTDDERLLRDLAFALIEPPYDRNRWDSVWREWGLGRRPAYEIVPYDRAAYWVRLADTYRRSEASAYSQINTDARNDVVRIEPFFSVALRVVDMDRRRAQSIEHVALVTEPEVRNAINRNRENTAIVGWVCGSLNGRAASYRFALGRLVLAAPSPAAAEVDRSLNYLQMTVSEYCRPGARARVVAARG